MKHTAPPLFEAGKPKRTVIYDIDGTLTPDTPDELSGRVYWHMHQNNLLTADETTPRRLLELREQYITTPTDQTHRLYLNNLNQAFDRQVVINRPSTMRKIARDALADVGVYPALMREVEHWHEQQIPLIVASGSPRIILDPIMDQVNARIGIGTQFSRSGNYFHPYKPSESRGAGKEQYLTSVLSSLALATMDPRTRSELQFNSHWPTPEEIPEDERVHAVAGYGNTMGDLGIFNIVDEAVVVNPRGNLRVLATANRWRTIVTKDEN